ncbi:MAG: hypothetical protein CL916_01210 [Deltaproteobacteria bacterium]|nr:hypothetical protein [Deltaproteobacteria bacterium]
MKHVAKYISKSDNSMNAAFYPSTLIVSKGKVIMMYLQRKLLMFINLVCILLACSSESEGPAFPNVQGPLHKSQLLLSEPSPTNFQNYKFAGSNHLAILLTDESSPWLGLAHGLKSVGIPFFMTNDIQQALKHDVILVYPNLNGANTSSADVELFNRHLEAGNSLIAFSPTGYPGQRLFGFDEADNRDHLQSLHFDANEMTHRFSTRLQETSIRLASSNETALGYSYIGVDGSTIAKYGDDSSAMIYKAYPSPNRTGHAYALGFDISYYTLKAHNGRFYGVADTYVNDYQAQVDTLLRLLANIYVQGESNPIQLASSPHNKEFTALITHDIDYAKSLRNALEYAEYEKSMGIKATYFIQSKYISDGYEQRFFSEAIRSSIDRLVELGMEIASHTVSHSNEFKNMPLGTGQESYPSYRPYVEDFATVKNASIAGELRVSKFLLEYLSNQVIKAFRPGHLSLPFSLPQMLESTDYQYSSSITANEALTHLPFQMMIDRKYDVESQIFEFPVTIEDEAGKLLNRLDEAIELAEHISRHGGLVNILIHTNITGHKLEFEKRFIETFKDRAWFTHLSEYGQWWRARNSIHIDVEEPNPNVRILIVESDDEIEGLSLKVPINWNLDDEQAKVDQSEHNVLTLQRFKGRRILSFKLE